MNCEIFLTNLSNKFHLNANLDDIVFNHGNIEPYNFHDGHHGFGEKDCLLFTTQFTIFNVGYSMKFLSFVYDTHAEILKLEIVINNDLLQKEVSSCRNFLQRKRNLNLAFNILKKIANLYESRRLICQTILQKQDSIRIESNEYGVNIKCNNGENSVKLLEIDWGIAWDSNDCEVGDFLEFYCNQFVLKNDKHEMRRLLETLANDDLNFHKKLKLWRKLIRDVYKNELKFIDLTDIQEISDTESISDSEDDSIVFVKIEQQNIIDNILLD